MQLLRTRRHGRTRQRGFSLVELVVVVGVVSMVGGLVIVAVGGVSAKAENDMTLTSLDHVRAAIYGKDATRPSGYAVDMQRVPLKVTDLLVRGTQPPYDFERKRGWRGPYLSSSTGRFPSFVDDPLDPDDGPLHPSFAPYGAVGDPAPLDGFGRPIVVQIPDATGDGLFDQAELFHARVISAGLDGVIQTPRTDAETSFPGTALLPRLADCGDDVVLYVRATDARP